MPETGPDTGDGPLVAVLGGGQLGRMLGLAGVPLGVRFRFLDPSATAPARALGPLVVGPLGDLRAIDEVASGATAVTYEWEGAPAESARRAEQHAPVSPPARALEVAQDRLLEKTTFRRIGIDVPPFAAVTTQDDFERALESIGVPAVVKTRRGGYDGKGQHVVHAPGDVDTAWNELGSAALIVEALVPFERELSVLAVRGRDGTTACYPLVENVHEDGILRISRAPAPRLTPELQAAGETIAGKILDELDYVGVLAIELFEHGDLLVANELAPRVHNSGHWTIEGAETSQFENHLRAVLGWPLGAVAARGYAAMVNCIGALPARERVLAIEGAHLHDYDKEPRPRRKVGHITVTATEEREREERLAQVLSVVGSAT